jgi:hypothetical protein
VVEPLADVAKFVVSMTLFLELLIWESTVC